MTRFKLDTAKRVTTFGTWVRQRDGSYRCGNVMVCLVPRADRPKEKNWRIFVRETYGEKGRQRWTLVTLRQRPWGYGHAGQAKIGAAMVAAHQRGAFR